MKLHPKLNKPKYDGYYLVEYQFPQYLGRNHYQHIYYNATFDLWNSGAQTEAEAEAERNNPKTMAGDDTVITAYTYMPDRSLNNYYRELLYAGNNHV